MIGPVVSMRSRILVLASMMLLGTVAVRAQIVVAAAMPPEEEAEFDEYAQIPISDPFAPFNRTMFRFNDSVYRHVFRPASNAYETVVPGIARRGIHSFFDNVRYPVRLVGCLLQGKVQRAGLETGKFLINTTVGIGGLVRASDRVPELRHVPGEDVGQALGHWGLRPGPYLVLPILGPSSLRDAGGIIGDSALSPTSWRLVTRHGWEIRTTVLVTNTLRDMPDRLRNYESVVKSAVDPYSSVRNGYLQFREAAVQE
jgi:phospholipid-binding lipoprotein MlaA